MCYLGSEEKMVLKVIGYSFILEDGGRVRVVDRLVLVGLVVVIYDGVYYI